MLSSNQLVREFPSVPGKTVQTLTWPLPWLVRLLLLLLLRFPDPLPTSKDLLLSVLLLSG